MQSPEDIGSTFGRAWDLLVHNWILIVPGIVISIVSVLLLILMALLGVSGFTGEAGLGAAAVVMLALLLTVSFTTGMAAAAWRTGRAHLSDGVHAFTAEGRDVFVAMVLVVLLGLVAVVLALPTLLLSLPLFAMIVLYVFPSVIVGGNTGPQAFAESARLAMKNWLVTLGLIVLLCVIAYIARSLEHALNVIPFLGLLLGYLLQQMAAAYIALVVVGEYIKLRPTVHPETPQ